MRDMSKYEMYEGTQLIIKDYSASNKSSSCSYPRIGGSTNVIGVQSTEGRAINL